MRTHKVKKLPLVDADGTLLGLITAKDYRSAQLPFATRDAHGRLRVGAAIGAKGDYLERAAELLRAEVDVLVIDIAHGHSVVMARAIEAFRKRFGDVELIAGNVATADGARFCSIAASTASRSASGPAAAARRVSTPTSACLRCRRWSSAGGGRGRVPLIADGGVRRMARSCRRCSSAATRSCSAACSPARWNAGRDRAEVGGDSRVSTRP